MNPTLARYRRALALPAVVGISLVLLGSGLAVSTANGQLTEATEADIAAATGAYSPSTGLDATAPVPRGGEVGGAGAIEPADRPVSLAPEARQRYPGKLCVASLGAVAKKVGSDAFRISYDATHRVQVNHCVRVLDQLSFPLYQDLSGILRELAATRCLSLTFDSSQANRQVPVREQDWGYQA